MNTSDIIGIAMAIPLLLRFGWMAYQARKERKAQPPVDPIIVLWKNTEPRIQVSGKKYLEMLNNL